MTKYYIIANDTQKVWDCQPKNFDGQFQNIGGIEYDSTNAFVGVGGYFVKTNTEPMQNKIDGEMVFLTQGKYYEFKTFITNSDSFVFRKIDTIGNESNIDVVLKSFSIAEPDRFNTDLYICDIDLLCTSQWYNREEYKDSAEEYNTSTFDFSFPFQFPCKRVKEVKFSNPDNSDLFFRIMLYPYMYNDANEKLDLVNPVWELYEVIGKTKALVKRGKATITLSQSSNVYIVMDSTPSVFSVWKQSTRHKNANRVNIYSQCDDSQDLFLTTSAKEYYIKIYSDSDSTATIPFSIEVINNDKLP